MVATSLKRNVLVVVGATLVVFVAAGGFFVTREYRKGQRVLQAVANAQKLMREDTYGGATPEETFAMFLDALKAGNTDLASKYFVLSKQEEWRKKLELIKAEGVLPRMIKDLEYAQTIWEKKVGSQTMVWLEYSIYRDEQNIVLPNGTNVKIPAGLHAESVSFMLNEKTQKWKIGTVG